MAFKASNKRERRPAAPVGRGVPIQPSAALREKYAKEMKALIASMMEDYREKLLATYDRPTVSRVMAMDSATSMLDGVVASLNRRWSRIFENFAKKMSPKFVKETADAADAATLHSLSVAGLNAPTKDYNANVARILEAEVPFNSTLITKISEEAHNKVYDAVMLSLTSPDPEKQGQAYIKKTLSEVGISCNKRADLIARDQTSKIYASLSSERMRQNGVEKFEWLHSSAGKVPRPEHLRRNGQIYSLDDPRLWEGPKQDQGPPGWAINCRCTRIPIIG